MSDPNDVYTAIATVPSSFLPIDIQEHTPHPTRTQIEDGKITRYFIRRINDSASDVIEVDQSTYQSLKTNNMYHKAQLDWRISGELNDVKGSNSPLSPVRSYTGVLTANRLSLLEADKEMPGLRYKIQNFKQFWIGK